MEDEIRALLRPLVKPSPTEVRRAKKLIIDALGDGASHDVDELLGLLLSAENEVSVVDGAGARTEKSGSSHGVKVANRASSDAS